LQRITECNSSVLIDTSEREIGTNRKVAKHERKTRKRPDIVELLVQLCLRIFVGTWFLFFASEEAAMTRNSGTEIRSKKRAAT